MNLSFVVENTVVAHKHGAKGLDHVEFVVKLMTFIFVKQVDDLKRTQLRLSSWCWLTLIATGIPVTLWMPACTVPPFPLPSTSPYSRSVFRIY